MKWLLMVLGLCLWQLQAFSLEREAFTFTNYDLNVRIEPEQQRIGVRGTIILRNDSDSPQKHVSLQISSSLHWSAIAIGDKPVEFDAQTYTSDIDHTGALSEAIVTLPQEIFPKSSVELNVGYEGIIPLDATRLRRIGVPKELAPHDDWDEIGRSFTAVRGAGYVAWYPVAMEAASLSDGNAVFETVGKWKRRETAASMAIDLCLDADESKFISVMNDSSAPASSGNSAVSTTDCQEHRFSPMNLVSPGFGIGNYSVLGRKHLSVYFLPGHNSNAENYALAFDLAAPFVTGWFGTPRNKAKVIELADSQASPYESGSVLFAPLTGNDSTKYGLVAVHQLTHAAFPSTRLWIYEGLAHFAQAAYIENNAGRQKALDFMVTHRGSIAASEIAVVKGHDPHAAAAESLINTAIEEFYRSKAMYVWWMIRDMIGDKALTQALAQYRPDQDKEPSYMPRLIEGQSNRDLEWFFDDWVYRDRGLPDFRVESVYPRKMLKGVYLVTVTVENLGSAGAEVPVILRTEGAEISKRLVVRAKSKASIRIESASIPKEAVVNDGSVPESDMTNNSYKIVLPTNQD
ncbi:MAG: hypothetical protein ACRD2U_13725 [Terriglobales bacterium]